jgi:hypothetical protein
MPNALLSPKVYANAGLALLKNNLVAARKVTGEFKDEFKKVGDTVYVKRPPEFTVRQGATASAQDVVEGEVAVKIDRQRGVDVQFTSIEETLTVDSLLKSKTLDAAMAVLAQDVDSAVLGRYVDLPNWVGTPGQKIDSAADFAKAPERMDNQAIPTKGRFALLSASDNYGLLGAFIGLYAQNGVAEDALTKAKLPTILGVDPYMTQSVVNHVTGTRAAGTVNGAGQAVTYDAVKLNYQQTLNVTGVGANATVKAGDVFTVAGVFAVNPRTKAVLDYLQPFTVLADVTANASGVVALTIACPMIVSGAYQTVSAVPAAGAGLSWWGAANTAYPQNLVLTPQAIGLVSAKLVRPYSGECDFAVDKETGIALRYWRFSDGVNDTHMHRWDVLYGVKTLDARQGVRVSGTA